MQRLHPARSAGDEAPDEGLAVGADVDADQAAIEIDRRREAAQLVLRERSRLREDEAVQAVRRTARRREALLRAEDQAEADRTLLLAQQARLVADREDRPQHRRLRQVLVGRLAVLLGEVGALAPVLADEVRQVGRIRTPSPSFMRFSQR